MVGARKSAGLSPTLARRAGAQVPSLAIRRSLDKIYLALGLIRGADASLRLAARWLDRPQGKPSARDRPDRRGTRADASRLRPRVLRGESMRGIKHLSARL